MATLVNLTYDLADLIGTDYDPRHTRVFVKTNITPDPVIVVDGTTMRLGDVTQKPDADGTGEFTGLIATNSAENPTSFAYRFIVQFNSTLPHMRGKKQTWTSSEFPLTATANIAAIPEAFDGLSVPVAWRSDFRDEMETIRDEAAVSAALAQDISNIEVAADVVAAVDLDAGSAFRVQQDARLSATYVAQDAREFNVQDFGALGDGTTDDTAAINAAISAMPTRANTFAASSGVLYFPAGRYVTAGGHVLAATKRIHIRGDGPYNTFIQKKTGSTAQDLFTISADYGGMSHITVNGDTAAASGDGVVLNSQATYLDHVFVSGFPGNGVTIGKSASAINHQLTNVVVRLCKGYGIEVVSASSSTDGQWINVNVGTSGKSGVRIATGSQQLTNVHVWNSGIEQTSGTDKDGFWLAAGGNVLTNCVSETNMGHGVRIASGAHYNQIIGLQSWGNFTAGLYGFASQRTVLVGCVMRQNGVGNTTASSSTGYSGIVNENGTNWHVSGCSSWEDGTAMAASSYATTPANPYPGRAAVWTQTYAYSEINGGVTPNNNTITGNRWRKQDHKNGSQVTLGVASAWIGNDLGTDSVPTLASAASVSLPVAMDFVKVFGTTAITSITASRPGRKVTLQFTDASPGALTDGSNLRLASSFTPTQNDTITLICDGTDWIEVGRTGDV